VVTTDPRQYSGILIAKPLPKFNPKVKKEAVWETNVLEDNAKMVLKIVGSEDED
jgi:hypothetical protein